MALSESGCSQLMSAMTGWGPASIHFCLKLLKAHVIIRSHPLPANTSFYVPFQLIARLLTLTLSSSMVGQGHSHPCSVLFVAWNIGRVFVKVLWAAMI